MTMIAGLPVHWETFPAAPDCLAPGDEARFVGLWVVDDPDALIEQTTQEEFDGTDERMPYFGMIWPSAESLAAGILAGPRLDGRRVLDLGCGLGLCGLAARQRGARVTFFDWEPRALEIVAASIQRQEADADSAPAAELLVGDWRTPPPMGLFDLILGADVLYEERNGPAVVAFLAAHLEPGGEARISDPGRRYAGDFPSLAGEAGLELIASEPLPPQPHNRDITLLRFRRR
jgi:predicted nicotinamide N-methyase